jgi:hypothetical protein
MSSGRLEEANHFVFEGKGVSGSVDTTSITGQPIASVTVDGVEGSDAVIETWRLGLTATMHLDGSPDLFTRSVTVVVPQVNVDGTDGEAFEGLAIVVRRRTSIGGPGLVQGAIETYDVRTVNGTASSVRS